VAAFFVRRPIVAMVCSIVLVLGGLIMMRSLPVARLPEIVPPQIMRRMQLDVYAPIAAPVAAPVEEPR
jgi:multidrug efflux pump